VSMPDADKVKRALEQCDFVVVSDCIADTDTVELANVKLPAAGWSEKDGSATNLERRISRQRALFTPLGEAKPDWWIISQVAQRMGFAGFGYQSSAEIFREHAALSGFENDAAHGLRDFDISAFAALDQAAFDDLLPIQWPVNAETPAGSPRLFGDKRFFTPNGKARFVAIKPRAPINPASHDYPFVLNTGRVRDQWHTMTRTGLAPKLNSHRPEPTVEIHPSDALRLGLRDRCLAWIESRWGSMLARVDVTPAQQIGSLFVPMHWSGRLSSRGRVGPLVNPVVDPLSGQPESKQTPVKIRPWRFVWQAWVLSNEPLNIEDVEYQVKIKGDGFWRYQLAGSTESDSYLALIRRLLSGLGQGDWLEFQDNDAGVYRLAKLQDQQLIGCVFLCTQGDLPESDWLGSLFQKPALSRQERFCLLSGIPPLEQDDAGKTVCSCFSVGDKTISKAIKTHHLTSVAEIGACLGAGTGCGSCLPELKLLLLDHKRKTTEPCTNHHEA